MAGRSRDELRFELLPGVQRRGLRVPQLQTTSRSGGTLPDRGHHTDPDPAEFEHPGDADHLLGGQGIAENEHGGGEPGGPVRIRTRGRERVRAERHAAAGAEPLQLRQRLIGGRENREAGIVDGLRPGFPGMGRDHVDLGRPLRTQQAGPGAGCHSQDVWLGPGEPQAAALLQGDPDLLLPAPAQQHGGGGQVGGAIGPGLCAAAPQGGPETFQRGWDGNGTAPEGTGVQGVPAAQ